MKTRKKYEAPFAKDLSSRGASGQKNGGILGDCTDGQYPYAGCKAGADVGNPGTCSTGPTVNVGDQCRPWGSQADSTCSGGGWQ